MARQVISAPETLRDGGREPVRAGRHHRPTPRPAEGASSCPCSRGGEQLPLRQWEGSSEGRVGGVAAPCAPEHAAQPVVVDRATP